MPFLQAPAVPLFWPVALGVAGAIFGSFIATLVVRWPEGRSVVSGRSACDGCGHPVRARHLIPLVSWLLLRGRCRDCGAAIDLRHVAIEALAAMIGVSAGLAYPNEQALAGAVFGWMLLALAGLDLVALWLPDRLTGLLAALGLAAGVSGLAPDMADRITGGVIGWASLWLIAKGYYILRGRDGLGGGDPKLLAGIGLWLGWRMLPVVLLVASLIGLGAAMGLALRGRAVARHTAMPFGAFLACAAYVAWLTTAWWQV